MTDSVNIKDYYDLSGKTALITGASSGFGERFAHILAAAGANIIIAARRMDRLENLKTELNAYNTHILPYELDVTKAESIEAVFVAAEAAHMPVDILVNNAGMNITKPAHEISPAEYQQIIDTNMTAPFFLAREAARRMIARKSEGRIINIASVGSYRVLPGITPYCMSKAALAMMTKGLAREWARYHINVNAICPGYIATEINDFWWETEGGKKQINSWPRRRLGEKADLDGALLLLAGAAGRGMTGTLITVDDGQYI